MSIVTVHGYCTFPLGNLNASLFAIGSSFSDEMKTLVESHLKANTDYAI